MPPARSVPRLFTIFYDTLSVWSTHAEHAGMTRLFRAAMSHVGEAR